MRKKKNLQPSNEQYKIMVVDDEEGIVDSLSVVLKRNGYQFLGLYNPIEALEILKKEHYDLLILDYLMHQMHGDRVVEKIRKFNKELYILLLTGHKDIAPPIHTIRSLDIQGYCEKSESFDQLVLLIESGIKSVAQMRTIKKFHDGLNKILQSVPKIYQLQPIGNILEDILAEILPLVNSKHAFILVDDMTNMSEGNKSSIFRGIGRYKTGIDNFMEMLDTSLIEQIGHARVCKQVVTLNEGVILPLVNEFSESMGVIYVETTNIDEGNKLLEIYASQAASSLNNAFLHSLVNIKNDELNKTYEQLRTRYMDTIEALRLVVDAKDEYTRGHSDRVAYFAVKIGMAFGIKDDELETLRISGIFHDVGKIGTADDILLKTERLEYEEYEEIKKHPLKGANILSAVSMFRDVVPIVRCHHERMDGNGYPMGLKGDQVPFLARIIAVADAFDAMMSDRHYRAKLGLEEAVSQLVKGSGTQFDSRIVDMFINLLDSYDTMVAEVAATYEVFTDGENDNSRDKK